MKKKTLALSAVLLMMGAQYVSASTVFGSWLTQAQSAVKGEEAQSHVKIDHCAHNQNQVCGTITWLQNPIDPATKKPKLDKHNPKEGLKDRPLMGLQMLEGFTQNKSNPNLYEGGTIYNPKEGKTYKCKMTLKDDVLEVRGYIGIPLLGETKIWTKVKK